MKTLLVTGGAGFIGSNFINYILDKYKDYRIINLDLLTYAGNLNNLKVVLNNHNHIFVHGDINNRDLVDKLFKEYNFNYVINFAAESHVDRSIVDPCIFIKTNIQGTQVLLDAAKRNWFQGKDRKGNIIYRKGVKFIQISTDEVYGTLDLNSNDKFTEESPLAPNSPYSASKASADMLVRAYYKTFGLPINITRCSNNYGPNQYPEKLIPLMIINALQDKPLPIYGDGLQIRDWIHVKDHCSAIDTVLHTSRNGEVYNIGGNNEKTNIEIVKLILQQLGKPIELIKYIKDRPGHDRRYAIDNIKITSELGWQPIYEFEQGMEETINWYKRFKREG